MVGVTNDKFTDGTAEPMDIDNDDVGSGKLSDSKVSYTFDTCKIRVPRENKEMKSFLNNCMSWYTILVVFFIYEVKAIFIEF